MLYIASNQKKNHVFRVSIFFYFFMNLPCRKCHFGQFAEAATMKRQDSNYSCESASALYTHSRVTFIVQPPIHTASVGELTMVNKKASSDSYRVLWAQRENQKLRQRGRGGGEPGRRSTPRGLLPSRQNAHSTECSGEGDLTAELTSEKQL